MHSFCAIVRARLIFVLMLTCATSSFPLAAAALPPTPRLPCPKINGLIDTNCDGKLTLAGLGDSIVFGRIQNKMMDPKKGYLGRIRARFPKMSVVNLTSSGVGLGLPGDWTQRMYCRVNWADKGEKCLSPNIDQKVRTANALLKIQKADYLVIDIGRNDFFIGASAPKAAKLIEQTVRYIRQVVARRGYVVPIIGVAKIIPSTRTVAVTNRPTTQQVYVQDLNAELIRIRSVNVPSYLDFSVLSPSLISIDGLHPSPAGYAALTTILESYLKGKAQTSAAGRHKLMFGSSP